MKNWTIIFQIPTHFSPRKTIICNYFTSKHMGKTINEKKETTSPEFIHIVKVFCNLLLKSHESGNPNHKFILNAYKIKHIIEVWIHPLLHSIVKLCYRYPGRRSMHITAKHSLNFCSTCISVLGLIIIRMRIASQDWERARQIT